MSIFKWIESVTHWLKRVVTQPAEELNRWQMAVRFSYDLGRFGARQLKHDRASQMAGALSFRTLFALLPVIVVATVLVRAMGAVDNFSGPLNGLFEFWGLDTIRILPPGDVVDDVTTLDVWLWDRVREAQRLNAAAVGWIGAMVTAYAAISLIVTIEDTFNVIYRAPRGRRWTRRVPLYWFLLTLSPVMIAAGSYIDKWFREMLSGIQAYGWLSASVGGLWSVLATWLLMLAIYVLLPNAKVRIRSAMAGALVAAILLETGKRTMGVYLENAMSISQLYGSLGLIPLFMFWVYLMWLAVLFGLQVSSTLQHLRGRQLAEFERHQRESTLVDPSSVIVVMQCIAAQFQRGREAHTAELASNAGLPEAAIERIVDELVTHGLVRRVANADDAVTLARPADQIAIRDLLKVGFQATRHGNGERSCSRVVERLQTAQTRAAEDATLATILAENG